MLNKAHKLVIAIPGLNSQSRDLELRNL